jgi:hypothetical protein
MQSTRRLILAAAIGALPGAALAQAITGRASARKVGGAPKMIAGDPPRLDFGGGLVVPMDRRIFGVLWEGQDRWITYARGVAANRLRAMALAQEAAETSMKTLLLTLAFKPERMEKVEGSGWRPISKDPADLVFGALKLPGKALMPVTEGFGQGGATRVDPATGADDPTGAPSDYVHALTGYMVMKSEVDLDHVREYARLIEPAAAG